jgi:ABC-type nitrate/sulfonate/bicarbonate transport system permease component
MSSFIARDWRGVALPVGALVTIEVLWRISGLHSDLLAPPSIVFAEGLRFLGNGMLLEKTTATMGALFGGLAFGMLAGIVLGTLLGLVSILDRLLEFPIEVIRPIPSIALFPIALLAFGFGYRLEIFIIAFSTTWPVLILTRAAVASIEPTLFDVSRSMGLGLASSVRKIILPAMMPRLFVAFRLAASLALIVAVTVEIAGNPVGLGAAIITAQQSLQPARMLAILVWIGLLGWSLNAVLLWIERRLFSQMTIGRK